MGSLITKIKSWCGLGKSAQQTPEVVSREMMPIKTIQSTVNNAPSYKNQLKPPIIIPMSALNPSRTEQNRFIQDQPNRLTGLFSIAQEQHL